MSVCLSVCPLNLTSGASVRRENAATHSAGNEGQKNCDDFSETAPLPRSSAPSHDGHGPAENSIKLENEPRVTLGTVLSDLYQE